MKKFLTFLFLFVSARVYAEQVNINQFGGLNTDDSPATLTGNQTPDSENLLTDIGPGTSSRLGYTSLSTTTCTGGLWIFPHSNGTRYTICADSGNLKASTGGGTFNITISTIATGVTTAATSLGNTLYFANITDGLKSWDTSSVSVASSTLKVSQLVTHKGRVWAAGLSSAPRTIFGSAFNNGGNFTLVTDPAVTDPVQFLIGGRLDESLTGVYASFQDKLMWTKSHSFGAIIGNDRSDFTPRVFSDKVGTAYLDSIQDCDGLWRFLGSNKTIYEFNGSTIRDITQTDRTKIKTLMETVSQGDANSRAWTQTTQADWQAGTITSGLSTTISPGNVITTTGTLIDDFSDGDYTSNPAWTLTAASGTNTATISGGGVIFQSNNKTTYSYFSTTVTFSTAAVSFDYTGNDSGIDISLLIYFSTNSVPISTAAITSGYRFEINRTQTSIAEWRSGSYVTLVTGGAHNGGGISTTITIIRTSNNGIRMIDNGSGTLIDISSTTPNTITNFTSLIFAFIQNPSNTNPSGVGAIDNIKQFTGSDTLQTQSFNIGTSISGWGPISITANNNGGSQVFAIYGDTNSTFTPTDATTFTSSQTITDGSIPTIATASYVGFTDNFSRTASTQTSTLSEFIINWSEGSTLRVASAWTNLRYWLAVAVSSTANNRMLVFDRNQQWQKWSGINATVMALGNSGPIFANTLGTWQGESGYTDNGTAIASYYRTPTYSPSSPNLYSTLNDLYLTTDNSANTLATTFQTDGVNTDYSLSSVVMNTTSGIQNVRLPFPFSGLQQGKNINFKFSVSGSSFWRILGANLDFLSDRVSQ